MFDTRFNFMDQHFLDMMKQTMDRISDAKEESNPWKNWFQLFQGGGNGSSTKPEETSKLFFETALQAYEQQVGQFFKLPQLGLTRTYQDRTNQCINEFNRFVLEMNKFYTLLAAPMGKAMVELEKNGGITVAEPENVYEQWIKILERCYQELFHSPDFVSTLHRLLARYSTYQAAQNQLITDFLKYSPISSKEDFDAVARENYEMKRELRKIKKKMEILEEKLNHMMS